VRITFDPAKRAQTLADRAIDFADALHVFAGRTLNVPDRRRDYGEIRVRTIGNLAGRMVMVVWTPRAGARQIISMRKCNDREQARYRHRLETA
jgi:uncharacterized DUF497 family protein